MTTWAQADLMDRKPVVLVIDDDPNNLALMTDFLEELDFTVLAAEDGESGVTRAAYAEPDLVLLDIMMPGIDGYETCRRLKAQRRTRDIPVICMTALAETEHKLRGFAAGCVDYITKPFQREEVVARVGVHLHLRKLNRELQASRDFLEERVVERTAQLEQANRALLKEMAERNQTEVALRASERKFHAIFDNAFQLMGLMTPDGTILESNRTSLDFSELDESAVVNKLFWEVPWWNIDAELRTQLKEAVGKAAAGDFVRFEVTHRGTDLSLRYFDFSIKPVRDEAGTVVLLIPEGRDITAHRKLEEQLRQSQKMEAIGTLVGGIAHDFNNILTGIMGFGGILGMRLEEENPLNHYVAEILSASERGANLIRSLLSCCRKQVIKPGPEDLNDIVKKIEKFLLRIIGEDIEFETRLDPQALVVNADSGQIEQVLMNLVANARDAMPGGGALIIKTERLDVMRDSFPSYLLEPGSYAVISVSDTGTGFDEGTKQRIFEPFFTTKELGKGTGLGLSIVYGIIEQHNGQINVCSEPGRGTTFKIYLRLIGSEIGKGDAIRPLPPVGGRETILVAEDDSDARRFITQTLRHFGYQVIEAADGEEALRTFIQHEDEIQLLILDVVMPKMNGKEVYQEICNSRKNIPVLFSSGYTADIINNKGVLEEGINFIPKPMTPHELLAKVRAIFS